MKTKLIGTLGFSAMLLMGCSEEPPEDLEPQANTIEEESDSAIGAVKRVEEAVVGITNIQRMQSGMQMQNVAAGTGSGVIYKKEGEAAYVVTNQHVVEGATQVEVTLMNGEKRAAEIVGQDVYTDLAVVKMKAEGIGDVAEFGNSGKMQKGETVLAIGNPLGLDFFGSVTKGVLSGKERIVPIDINKDGVQDWQVDVMQTDAAINPGNSGGALVNLKGEVIGINSMKIAQDSVEGIAFVIPSDTAVPVIEKLEVDGEVKRPQLGIGLVNVSDIPSAYKEQYLGLPQETTDGVVVLQVLEGKSEFQKFDIITGADGKPIKNVLEMRNFVLNEEIGNQVVFQIIRNGNQIEIPIELKE